MRNNILVGSKTGTLVTTGNLRLASGRWAIPEGSFAFFNPDTLDVIDPGPAFSYLDHPEIGIAVGYRNQENELQVRMGAANKIIGDQITDLTCSGPRCSQNEVKDILIGDCDINPGGVYTIVVEVFDERSAQRLGTTVEGIPYKFSVTAEEVDMCEVCDEGSRLEQVICALVNKINTGTVSGVAPEGIWGRDRRIERQMFRAAKIMPYATLFEIDNATSGPCIDCDTVVGLNSLTITPDEGEPIVIDFTSLNTLGLNHTEYMEEVVSMINTHPTANVFATLLTAGQNCCGHKIDIMHCADNLTLLAVDGERTVEIVGTTTEPLTRTCTRVEYCHTCTPEEQAPVALSAGIRIYFDPIKYDIERCGYVTWPLVPVAMGKIYASDRGYLGFTKWCVFEAYPAIYPMNLGWQWMEYELATDMDGIGRENNAGIGSQYRMFDNEYSKRNGLATKANEQYFALNIEHFNTYHDKFSTNTSVKNFMRDILLFPVDAQALAVTIMEHINSYTASIPGKKLPVLTCGIQQGN